MTAIIDYNGDNGSPRSSKRTWIDKPMRKTWVGPESLVRQMGHCEVYEMKMFNNHAGSPRPAVIAEADDAILEAGDDLGS